MARLTMKEKRLLQYRPTPETWVCAVKGWRFEADIKVACDTVNPGTNQRCWICAAPKPRKPKLLWPAYVAVCKKAGHEPGTVYRPSTNTTPLTQVYPKRRKKGRK